MSDVKVASPLFKFHDMSASYKNKKMGEEASAKDDLCAADLVSKESVPSMNTPNCSVCSRPHGVVKVRGGKSLVAEVSVEAVEERCCAMSEPECMAHDSDPYGVSVGAEEPRCVVNKCRDGVSKVVGDDVDVHAVVSVDVPVVSCMMVSSTYFVAFVGRESAVEYTGPVVYDPPSREYVSVMLCESVLVSGENFDEYVTAESFLCPDPPCKYES